MAPPRGTIPPALLTTRSMLTSYVRCDWQPSPTIVLHSRRTELRRKGLETHCGTVRTSCLILGYYRILHGRVQVRAEKSLLSTFHHIAYTIGRVASRKWHGGSQDCRGCRRASRRRWFRTTFGRGLSEVKGAWGSCLLLGLVVQLCSSSRIVFD